MAPHTTHVPDIRRLLEPDETGKLPAIVDGYTFPEARVSASHTGNGAASFNAKAMLGLSISCDDNARRISNLEAAIDAITAQIQVLGRLCRERLDAAHKTVESPNDQLKTVKDQIVTLQANSVDKTTFKTEVGLAVAAELAKGPRRQPLGLVAKHEVGSIKRAGQTADSPFAKKQKIRAAGSADMTGDDEEDASSNDESNGGDDEGNGGDEEDHGDDEEEYGNDDEDYGKATTTMVTIMRTTLTTAKPIVTTMKTTLATMKTTATTMRIENHGGESTTAPRTRPV